MQNKRKKAQKMEIYGTKMLTKTKEYRLEVQGEQYFNKNTNVKIELQIISAISIKMQMKKVKTLKIQKEKNIKNFMNKNSIIKINNK